MSSEDAAQQDSSRPRTPDSHFYPAENLKTPERQTDQAVNDRSPRPYNTPTTRNENSCKDGLQRQDAKARYPRLAEELRKWLAGPMPPKKFIDAFLPRVSNHPDRYMPSAKDAFIDIIAGGDEKEIYKPLVSYYILIC